MLEDFMSTYGSRLAIAIIGVGVGLLLLVVALYLVRRRSGPSPFLKGGKNRQPRLQVLDAAAVDARRRIVLIRRDNVEHLVMIGGPTDIVIETGIGAAKDGEAFLHRSEQPERLATPPAEPRLEQPERTARIAAPARQIEKPQAPTPRIDDVQVAQEVKPAKVEIKEQPAAKPAPVAAPSQPSKPAPASEAVIQPTVLPAPPAVQPPTRQMAPAAPAIATSTATAPGTQTAPDIGPASDALDAARRRVFQPAEDRTPEIAPQPAPASQKPPVTTAAETANHERTEKEFAISSEFDRILEEEMASNLAAEPKAPVAATFNPTLPKRDPATPKVTGATPDPSLQNEIARIFGEMSVTRDDRQG